ncbi:molybdopterin synthase catalytic subunit [Hydrogenimonas cancrithermarum]|uniref:Molybdopterin synthase catalytic subunit n=1 Tax=Hydrogenimonas cancrithermarum TaxID=2993563 RepID=A0ABM8FMI3_9BACT|nr:molybdenum cofactor biosynthesis protein MoaE [Hydrogenimonas cancrithermarum]BDY12829.1 molybdenum cofactor biosynthesis protein MoaE [Hydrogenimonas cancrithermarum]BDY12946.1 molybdenum cofactor biosynthesis protein MoaE [Hydrogenimonas cancrithermarum]
MVLIYKGPIDVEELLSRWYDAEHDKNFGAMVSFVGTIREEGGIEALSFDIYRPVLEQWFGRWKEKLAKEGALLAMAHSEGDVPVHKSSFACAIFSPKRRVALEMLDAFVEDFKANAPIWKYDVIDGKRIYAEKRSTPMNGSGLLLK